MACNKQKAELLHNYLDESLTLLEKKELENHLFHCDTCEKHLNELRKTVALIQSASHIKAPANFTENVMKQLPKQRKTIKWKTWLRKHPFLLTAAVFTFVFILSLSSIWSEGKRDIVVKGDGHFIVDEERGLVVIPEGKKVSGDLIVRNGNIEVAGEVEGNIIVINGEQYLASAGQVTGEIQEINEFFSWLWYQVKSFFSDVNSFLKFNK